MAQKRWPATIDESVGVVIATLSEDERAYKANSGSLAHRNTCAQHYELNPLLLS